MVDITEVPIDVCKAQNAARMPEYKRVHECVNRKEEKKMNRTECEEAVNDVCEMCFKSTSWNMGISLLTVLFVRSITKIVQR